MDSATIKFFYEGMKICKLTIFYSLTVKKITQPGLEYKLKKELGLKEYKRVMQSNIKHLDLQKKYDARRTKSQKNVTR